MKFGKVLQQSMQLSPRAWEPFWVDYKLLKKIIKDCAQLSTEEKLRSKKVKPSAKEDNDSIRNSEDETNFFRTLRDEIRKIATFFLKEQAKHATQIAAIEESFASLKSVAVPKDEDKTELMKACVSLYKELLLLENFAVMNFCGISKILKKHDKWTGYATRSKFMHTILMKQPFATYEPLLRMIDRLEQIFMATTGSTIEQHDAEHSSSRRGDGGSSSGFDRRHSTGTDASGNAQHNPAHHPPVTHPGGDGSGSGAGSGGGVGAQERRRAPNDSPSQDELSPRSDSSVTLVRVHALRSDVRELKKLESVSDYDGDGENEDDDAVNDEEARFIYAGDDKAVAERFGGHVPGEGHPITLPPLPAMNRRAAAPLTETHSDSDAAVIAMLSMKESLADKTLSGASSDGGDSSSTEAGRGYKRKAYTPLDVEMNKRKMSVTAILN